MLEYFYSLPVNDFVELRLDGFVGQAKHFE